MQPALRIATRRLKRRQQPHDQADRRGDDQPEGEDCAVDVDRSDARQPRRTERHQRAHADYRDGQPESAADRCQKQALREHLPNHAHPSGAQRGAHGEFTAPPRAEREQQIRHIHAYDQEHQSNRAENRQQRRLDGARDVILKPIDDHPVRGTTRAVISLGIRLRQRAKDYIEFVPGLIPADARTQPAHHSQMMTPFPAVCGKRGVVLQGRPELCRRSQHILERAGHHADHGEEVVIQFDLPTDNGAVPGEAQPP